MAAHEILALRAGVRALYLLQITQNGIDYDFSFNRKGMVQDVQADAGLGDEREQTVLPG